MSKHWCPDSSPLRVAPAPDDAARAVRNAPIRPRRPQRRLSTGEAVGLLLVAAVCAGLVLGLNQAFARPDVFAEEVVAPASARGR